MTAEHQNQGPSNEGADERNLSIQGSADESTIVVGDRNTIHQGPSYTTHVVSSFEAEQLRSQRRHLRRALLKQMKTDVALRLEDSLHNFIRVDLEQEEQRYQVGRRRKEPLAEVTPKSPSASHELIQRELAGSNNNEARESIPPAEQTYNIFHRSDIGGRLLILGEPGAGKTTELLTIAQRLVEAAIEDNEQPIPLIFELSSWTSNAPILTWLGQQLKTSYGVSKKLAEPLTQQLIQQGQLLPLLDGLDELGQRDQIECIKALEEFLAQHPALPVIICCRREEYEQGGEQLNQLNGAIYLQAVGRQQIQQYLQELGQELLWEGIQADPELLKLARSPLFLTLLVIAYQGQPIRDTSSLFDAYIHKQLHDPSKQGTYKPGKEVPPEQTLHYLRWLARQLKKRNETEFLIENLQPDWLGSKQKRRTYTLLSGLLFGLLLGIIGGALLGLFVGPRLGLSIGMGGPILGLINMMMDDLIDGLSPIKLQEQLKWSLRKGLLVGLRFWLFSGLSFGLLLGLILIFGMGLELINGLFSGLIVGLIGGLFYGLMGGLMGGLSNEAVAQKKAPNQGNKKGLLKGLMSGLGSGLMGRLMGGSNLIKPQEQLKWSLHKGLSSGLFFGLFIGPILGLFFGLFFKMNVNNINIDLGLFDRLILGLIIGLIGGLIVGLVFGLFGGLMGGLSNEAIEHKQVPNQGIKKSLQNGLLFGLISGLSSGLLFGLLFGVSGGISGGISGGLSSGLSSGLNIGLLFGLLFGLGGGIEAALQHFTLRFVLTKKGYTPWNYSLFLEHAARHRFIQRTGGRYRFVHDLLRQHFSQMTPQQ